MIPAPPKQQHIREMLSQQTLSSRRSDRGAGLRILMVIVELVILLACFGSAFLILRPASQMTVTSASATDPLCGTWQATTGPGFGGGLAGGYHSILSSVTVLENGEAWAVGRRLSGAPVLLGDFLQFSIPLALSRQAQVLHWDGNEWARVHVPNTGPLTDVKTLPGNEVWAVGEDVIRWNDTGWSIVGTAASASESLKSIDGSSQNDVWVVGHDKGPDGRTRMLMKHWDGNQWKVDDSFDRNTLNAEHSDLYDVEVISPSDAWAVGGYHEKDSTEKYPRARFLILHWDGAKWSNSPVPIAVQSNNGGTLSSISAVSARDIWAVGGDAITLHWNGEEWKVVDNPYSGVMLSTLLSVTAISNNEVWAVGSAGEYQSSGIMMHWDGNKWSITNPAILLPNHEYYGVAKAPSGDVFGVGGAWDNHQDGPWYALVTRLVSSPCATPTAPSSR